MKDLTGNNNCDILELTKPQKAFLEYCKEFGWGKLEVMVKNGEPVMASPLKQDFKFD